MSEQTLASIAAAASSISERLAGDVVPVPGRVDGAVIAARLEAWCAAVADGDAGGFARRLRWEGLSAEKLSPALGGVRWPDDAALPGWVRTLMDAVQRARGHGHGGSDGLFDPCEPLPFEDVVLPFVLLARERLRHGCDGAHELLGRQGHADLERYLLRRLTFVSAQTLHLEFMLNRAGRASGLERLLSRLSDPGRRVEYDRFVTQTRRDFIGLFLQYPVLGRLMACLTEQWVESTSEFLLRLSEDRADIEQTFGGGAPLGAVVSAAPGLSDPHHGGRSVTVVRFASGLELVYKPKDLGTEQAYQRLLTWLNERGAPLPFKVLTILRRPGYGWVERVAHTPCAQPEEARRFYQRAGMLLALVYALAGTDGHRDNLVADGAHPVLVDVECLMHHRPRLHREPEGAWGLARTELGDSVLGTGLLPSWEVERGLGGEERAWDISALHTAQAPELLVHSPQWKHVNTDHVFYGLAETRMPVPASQPHLGQVPLRLEDHALDVLDGFEKFYRFLIEQRPGLLAVDGPVRELGQQQVRLIHRNTRSYGSLHQRLREPAYLRDGADRSIQLERLTRAMVRASSHDGRQPRWWPLVPSEREQMERMDIPVFLARPTEDTVVLVSGEKVAGCLREPSLSLVTRRLRGLGEQDLQRQLGFVAGSLFGHVARDAAPVTVAPRAPAAAEATAPTDECLSSGALDGVARRIASAIAATAVRATDGSVTWIAPQYLSGVDRYQLQPISSDLNTGTCGIALFLAGLEKVTGETAYREIALGALQPLRQALREHGEDTAEALGVGGATGLGSVVYALTRMAQYLDEPSLLVDAAAAARLLHDQRVARAPVDVFVGTAGAALGLLALYDAAPDAEVLERAVSCGERVLTGRAASPQGYQAWATFEGRLLTGFSHGAAGIAYALLRLHQATGRGKYRSAAEAAIAYEDAIFVPAAANWPDLRSEQPAYQSDWCHGAPGIGLARLGALHVLDTAQVRRDIETGVQAALRSDVTGPDHLCCGNLGRTDVLVTSATRLDRPQLHTAALERTQEVLHRAQATGGFTLHDLLPRDAMRPGFFQGLAGVGYQLLRLAHPTVLPSALLWE